MGTRTAARPVARLVTELGVSGVGQLALGLAVLSVALSASDIAPARAIVPFAVVFVAIGGASLYASRWLRSAETTPADPAARVEEPSGTVRRCIVALVPMLIVIGVGSLAGPGLAVVFGGLVAGVGAVDLYNRNWARTREAADGEEILRELGRSPFTPGRRPLYTRPRSASTLLT